MGKPLLTIEEALAFARYCAHRASPVLRDPDIGDPDLEAVRRAVEKIEAVAPDWRHEPAGNVVRAFVGPHFRDAHPDWADPASDWMSYRDLERFLLSRLEGRSK